MKSRLKNILIFVILAAFFISFVVLLNFYSPDEIVGMIGARNAYIVMFFLSLFGGFSAIGSISFILALITLSVAGLNPLILGLVSGIALATGDMIMFFISSRGREIIKGKWEKRLKKLSKHVNTNLGKVIPFIIYFYMSFTPFPNDLLIISLAMIKYPLKKAYIPMILGDLTFPIIVAILASKGIRLLN